MPKRGACTPLIISDYIDHLALTQVFTYLNNLKYSLTSLALAMLSCLPSLFVNARLCSTPSIGAQPRNEPPSKQTKPQNTTKPKPFLWASGGWGGGGVGIRDDFSCAHLGAGV